MTDILTVNDNSLVRAAEMLSGGGLVAFPTETVYGLGANALNGQAVAKIFEAKGRPSFNPLIIHVADPADADALVEVDAQTRNVMEAFWPGPLTLILPRRDDCPVSELASAGLPTLAVRCPAHKTARALIKAAGVPLAAPSANRSGTISATTPAHVAASFEGVDILDIILAGGACNVGLESTVLDLSGDVPAVLRPGGITAQDISNALGADVAYEHTHSDAPKSPGMLLKHYAPSIPVRLDAIDLEEGEALLAFGSDKFMGIKTGGAAKNMADESRMNLSEDEDLHEAAANLFAMMRALDQPGHKAIAVMNIPETGLGIAINDRLRRAAAG